MAKRKIISVSVENRKAVEVEIKRCYDLATEAYNRNFREPTIEYRKSGRVAGTADCIYHILNFNSVLLEENGKRFINRTVGHEVAHLVAYSVFRDSGHGKSWKLVMRLFGLETSRCHSYNTTNSANFHKEKHVYECKRCKEIVILGSRQHKQQTRSSVYSHKKCKGAGLDYIKCAGKVSYKEASV